MFTISLKHPAARILFLLLLAPALAGLSWFIVRTAIGDSLAMFALRATDIGAEARLATVATAIRLAPADPATRLQGGQAIFATATADNDDQILARAVIELRAATQLNPVDYRAWLALGRALEQSGASAEARAMYERAAQLAPAHFEPHWRLGNFLLRNGQLDAACASFQVPMNNRPEAFPLIFNSLWEAYQGDVQAMLKALRPPRIVRAEMAIALVRRQRLTEALAVWKEAEQTPAHSNRMAMALIEKQFFHAAHDVLRQTPGAVPAPDQNSLLANGGFEQNIQLDETAPFLTWHIKPRAGMTISLDKEKPQAGLNSLRMSFELTDSASFIPAEQNVLVKPGARYRLGFQVRTEGLRSFSVPVIEVFDMRGGNKLHAVSAAMAPDINPWQEYTLDFTTSPDTEAVTIRIIRMTCVENPCPLKGQLWLDSFRLAPLSS
ncbi:MAG: carbohydrate binding domain-containing protein [Blastocatellia bacterium]